MIMLTTRWLGVSALTMLAALVYSPQPKPPATAFLTPAEGWVQLFDGETLFGWQVEGDAKIENGVLTLGGTRASTATFVGTFGYGNLSFHGFTDDGKDAKLTFNAYTGPFAHVAPRPGNGWQRFTAQVNHVPTDAADPADWKWEDISVWADGSKGFGIQGKYDDRTKIAFQVPQGQKLVVANIYFRPWSGYMKPLFNGKDLTGWKEHPGRKSKYTVNERGELNVKDGPGDLQTEEQWDDFILQLDCISNGKHLNSGIFFRCLPGQYQQGYEAQIRNQWEGDDRTKPVDFGTGAVYRRQPARKVVSTDGEWFTMTVLARGNRLMTWVNGYPVADFVDTRPPHENARSGTKLGKGAISIQGHDPTTDLSFRNIRLAALVRANP